MSHFLLCLDSLTNLQQNMQAEENNSGKCYTCSANL